jgi:hypothetical protein
MDGLGIAISPESASELSRQNLRFDAAELQTHAHWAEDSG